MKDQEILKELEQRWVTREELAVMLGTNDRNVRLWIEAMNTKLGEGHRCILSTAARKGYHIPSFYSDEDKRLVRMAINELKSKAISIFERRKPLEDFDKFVCSLETAQDNIQLTLF